MLGLIIFLGSGVGPGTQGFKKQFERNRMEPLGIGVNWKDALGRVDIEELSQRLHQKSHRIGKLLCFHFNSSHKSSF